jgi:hypothetical protein
LFFYIEVLTSYFIFDIVATDRQPDTLTGD